MGAVLLLGRPQSARLLFPPVITGRGVVSLVLVAFVRRTPRGRFSVERTGWLIWSGWVFF